LPLLFFVIKIENKYTKKYTKKHTFKFKNSGQIKHKPINHISNVDINKIKYEVFYKSPSVICTFKIISELCYKEVFLKPHDKNV
jgi:hypothetical protein